MFFRANILGRIAAATVLCFLTLSFATSCAKGSEQNSGELNGSIEIAGSSTVFPITSAVAEDFIAQHPGVEIPIRSTGTGGGFKNFFDRGLTGINNASRPIKASERASAQEKGIEAIEFQVAIDAITLVVNPDNPVDGLSTEELRQIWSPETTAQKWSDVDPSWPDLNFELYGPSSASGTFDYFTEVIMGSSGSSRSDYQKTEQDNTIVQAVEGSKAALGYFGLAYYLENKGQLKALAVNGVKPSLESARNGSYSPLSRPIFIYVSSLALARKEVQEFLRYYLSQTSGELISQVGYVPVPEETMQQNLKRLEQAIEQYADQQEA